MALVYHRTGLNQLVVVVVAVVVVVVVVEHCCCQDQRDATSPGKASRALKMLTL
jgi:hypothetical protein